MFSSSIMRFFLEIAEDSGTKINGLIMKNSAVKSGMNPHGKESYYIHTHTHTAKTVVCLR